MKFASEVLISSLLTIVTIQLQRLSEACNVTICPEDEWVTNGTFQYWKSECRRTPELAETHCFECSPSVPTHLASIANEEENTFIHSLLTDTDENAVWIGYKRKQDALIGEWFWRDGSPTTWINWNSNSDPNQPDRDIRQSACAKLKADGGSWADEACNDHLKPKYYFVCKREWPDSCYTSPCQNGAYCIENPDGYKCVCVEGYTGANCEDDIDECEATPCQNGATCHDEVNGYHCTCLPGYNGTSCEENIDECVSGPCQHGATCEDRVNDYLCSCLPGYNGTNCEEDIDECENIQCINSTCEDSIDFYYCTNCSQTKGGLYCDKDWHESSIGTDVFADEAKVMFDNGETVCQANDAHLISIHSEEENNFIKQLISNTSLMQDFWIGLRSNRDGELVWVDSSTGNYTNWTSTPALHSGVIGDVCVFMKNDGSWSEETCDNEFGFVCQSIFEPTPTTPGGPDPLPDNDYSIIILVSVLLVILLILIIIIVVVISRQRKQRKKPDSHKTASSRQEDSHSDTLNQVDYYNFQGNGNQTLPSQIEPPDIYYSMETFVEDREKTADWTVSGIPVARVSGTPRSSDTLAETNDTYNEISGLDINKTNGVSGEKDVKLAIAASRFQGELQSAVKRGNQQKMPTGRKDVPKQEETAAEHTAVIPKSKRNQENAASQPVQSTIDGADGTETDDVSYYNTVDAEKMVKPERKKRDAKKRVIEAYTQVIPKSKRAEKKRLEHTYSEALPAHSLREEGEQQACSNAQMVEILRSDDEETEVYYSEALPPKNHRSIGDGDKDVYYSEAIPATSFKKKEVSYHNVVLPDNDMSHVEAEDLVMEENEFYSSYDD